MPHDNAVGPNLVPRKFWLLVGGNILSPPPTWNRLFTMTEERNKAERDKKIEKREFQDAAKKAKAELEATKQAFKEEYGGGLAGWKQRRRMAEGAEVGQKEDDTARGVQRTDNPDAGEIGLETSA
ncbi:hypothetical protein CGCSCA4_v014785 [Colletotrichum siamense]|uniref:Uncharacterized protein n=1 Tax=Colletotrichum siamense TaxID=690259 RepID=A0A9P5EJY6_COLSI|nr:uncharacterized protein CGCS363_v009440 [Colletotrichum siamense]KAF4828564.1 hypothetical protein CGCSCA4_v014785 [Colletotrichum siamense]KAF4847579.1 hypothetical protein CGCSCA2_v012703 [Colletotrichum siamense]KAF5494496.1 hypothetical protein CGCS363_v009440 [Colletotrichum siamense]